jgi:hypothetical protein
VDGNPKVIAVIIPTLGRPHKVQSIVTNLQETAPEVTPYFVIEPNDAVTAEAVADVHGNTIINRRVASYAGAVNTALHETSEPYLYVSADDFEYHNEWLPPLLNEIDSFGICGSNDLHNKEVLAGTMATSFLIRRDYAVTACIDQPGIMLHEGYTHNFVDTEVIGTARSRNQFKHCSNSHVEHKHYLWGLAPHDDTYAKSVKQHEADWRTFNNRKVLWGG